MFDISRLDPNLSWPILDPLNSGFVFLWLSKYSHITPFVAHDINFRVLNCPSKVSSMVLDKIAICAGCPAIPFYRKYFGFYTPKFVG